MKHLKAEMSTDEVNVILSEMNTNTHYQKLRNAALLLCENGVITDAEYIKLCEKIMLKERGNEKIYPINPEEGD